MPINIAEFQADRVLDSEEVSALLRVGIPTIRSEVERGNLIAFRVGRLLKFRWSDVAAYIEQRSTANK